MTNTIQSPGALFRAAVTNNKPLSVVGTITALTALIAEKTGHKAETQELFEKLQPYGVLQFVRSGRIAITRHKKELLSSYLDNLDKEHSTLT